MCFLAYINLNCDLQFVRADDGMTESFLGLTSYFWGNKIGFFSSFFTNESVKIHNES